MVTKTQTQGNGQVTMARPLPPPPQGRQDQRRVTFGAVAKGGGHRVVLYGPGGIGKTTLAVQAPGPVAFVDLDDSLPRLRAGMGEALDDVRMVEVGGFAGLRGALQSEGWDEIKTIVIDSATRAEELCVAETIATIPHEKGHKVQRLEDYGFGKGYQFAFDTFLPLLADLDRHARAGRNVILVCHDCTTPVPNPQGEDWLRYEPRLQSPNSGKASIRLRTREWADHVLFLGYDVVVKDGVGRGSGTRTLYPAELPHCMAKSRTCQQPMVLGGSEMWAQIMK